jgi:phosphohistidine swiveling domain-containing protein
MADHKLAKLLETQISLTEWLRDVNGQEAALIYEEDNHKRQRLGVLSTIIGIPYDKPTQFEARALKDRSPALKKFLAEHGDELCALRLIPKPGKASLQKLRMRGKSIAEAMDWFDQQNIPHQDYLADFVPHVPDYSWATIFVVNSQGIFGEIYLGGHHILTQGFHEDKPPITFAYDFKNWQLTPHDEDALGHLKKLVAMLRVTDPAKQKAIQKQLNGTFSHDYLNGYFETTDSEAAGIWFIDYNRVLGESYSDFTVRQTKTTSKSLVSGRIASSGTATGTVKIVATPTDSDFQDGDILVCAMTSPDYLPLMKQAAAVVTDQGGILCHAAIVAREMKKPCIVGTGNATQVLKPGSRVTVDGDVGTVTEA